MKTPADLRPMIKKNLTLILTTFLFTIYAQIAFSQNGTLRGTVLDNLSQEGLIGANVILEGTSFGTGTDINGQFTFQNVPAGTYSVIISYVSYRTKKLEGVAIEAGKTTVFNTTLDEDLEELEGVVVIAARETSSDIAIITEIKRSFQVVSGVSSEQISRTLDSDAGQVIKRVPGINIQDNFVQIRGLAERYNPVMLHNAFAPSVEPDIKSFAFNILPSSQLDRMLVYKSPSADLSGDFAGGLVKVFTKSIPEENSLILEVGTQVRNGTTFQNFLKQKRGDNYFTGFNTGAYDLPAGFSDNLRNLNGNELVAAGQSLRNDLWVPESGSAGLDQKFSLTSSRRFNIGNTRVGNVTAVTYSNSYATFNVDRSDYNVFFTESNPIYNYVDDQYNQTIRVGLLFNWAFRFNERNTIEFKNLYNQNSIGQYVFRSGPNFEFQQFADLNFESFDQVYRGLYTGQLLGNHTLGDGKTKVDWVLGYNQSYRNQPDYKRYRADVDRQDGSRTLYVSPSAAQAEFLGRFFSDLNESSYSGQVNFTRTLAFKNILDFSPEIKFGGFYEFKERDFRARNIGYARASTFNFNTDLLNGTIENLFRIENINNVSGIRIDEQSNPNDSYDASNELMAGYALLNIPFKNKITAVLGARYEHNTQILNSATQTGLPVSVNLPVGRLLPSANISYNITEDMLVRAAYGETLNRPEFRELAPFGFYDFNTNFTNRGNPELETPRIHNFDLRWELYPTPGEVVSLAYFYKYFDNPIETLFVPGAGTGGAKNFTYGNADNAVSQGIEIEVKKSLRGLSSMGFVDDLSLLFNTALIRSQVALGERGIGQSDNRPLQGQAPYIFNTGLFYNNDRTGWQVNLLHNVVGKNILFVGYEGYPDIYTMPRNQVDISISKRINNQFTIKGGIADILNQDVLFLQDANDDGVFDRNNDQVIQRFSPGSVFQLGISYNFYK